MDVRVAPAAGANVVARHHVLVLMAHTGGGHLRAAEAVAEALRRRYGEALAVDLVDALGEYAPFPFSHLDRLYPWWISRAVCTWRWGYRLTDGQRQVTTILRFLWPWLWPRVRRLLRDHVADVIVSVHPLVNHVLAWARRELALVSPVLTLVTDPVRVHPFWLSPGVDRCLVGSTEAQCKALACGLRTEQVRIAGFPVNPQFVDGLTHQDIARQALGWSNERPAVLILGGAEGMGPLYEIARAIDVMCPGVQIGVITGRNWRLQERLRRFEWRIPVHIYGFVDHVAEMPRLMSAADLLVTKAGPGTLHEAFLAGLPLILSGAIPGQEEGNVRLVVEGGAGVWAPDPDRIAAQVADWMSTGDSALTQMSAASRALARPEAAALVADEIWRLVAPVEARSEFAPAPTL